MSTHRTVTRLSGLLVAGTFVLAACSSSGASTAPSAAAPSAAATSAASGAAPSAGGSAAAAGDPKTATSAADVRRRGCRLRRRQGRGPGQPHRHPARLGELRPDDHRLHGEVRDQGPVGPARRRQRRPRSTPPRTSPAPAASPTSSTSPRPSPWRTPTCSRRTRSRRGPTSPTRTRRRPASGPTTTRASSRSATTRSSAPSPRSPTSPIPSTRARSPSTATRSRPAAGFNGVVMAALANGGSADDIAPGVDFFKKLADIGQPAAGRPDRRPRSPPARRRSSSTGRTTSRPDRDAQAEGHRLEGRRPERRAAGRGVLQRGHQQGRPASCGRPLLGGVRLLAGGPERLAEGLRAARSACRR